MKVRRGIQVVEHSHGRLVIIVPPNYLLAGLLLAIGLAIAAVGLPIWYAFGPAGGSTPWAWLPLCGTPVLLGAVLAACTSRICLDRGSGLLHRVKVCAGLPLWHRETALDRIHHVEVDFYSGQPRLTIVLQDGGTLAIIRGRNRSGHRAAAQAINDFLAGR